MRIQDRISSIVASQLPEHIRSSYPTFVKFIEYYYKFLEQDQGAYEIVQNAKSYLDIDQTVDSFVDYFLKNYATDFTRLSSLDNSILIKRIKDLYESKGSELSFQLLFRILYNEDIEIRYPYENVLRPSDGIWDQKISVHVKKVSGNVNLFKTRIATYKKDGIKYDLSVSRLKVLDDDYCELFLETRYNTIPFEVDNPVYIYDTDGTILYEGTVASTATDYFLIQAGLGFKVGQIFTINFGKSVGMLIKITEVDSNGSIVSIQIVNYGYGYEGEFIIELHNDLSFGVSSSLFLTKTNGFVDTLTVSRMQEVTDPERYFESDYVRYFVSLSIPYMEINEGSNRYFSDNTYTSFNITYSDDIYQNYVADSVESFVDDDTKVGGDFDASDTPEIALVQFSLDAIAKYPGQYISYRGFVSEFDVRIQDNQLYQPFAYQIQTSIDIETFYDTVKKLVHQAGTNLFSNKILYNVIDLSGDIESDIRSNVFIELHDSFAVNDDELGNMEHNAIMIDDTITYSLTKNLGDSINITETMNVQFVGYVTTEDGDALTTEDGSVLILEDISFI